MAYPDDYRPLSPPTRPPLARGYDVRALERRNQVGATLSSDENAVLAALGTWRGGDPTASTGTPEYLGVTGCDAQNASRLEVLFSAARTAQELGCTRDFETIANFVHAHYGVTVPPVPDRLAARSVAARVARLLFRSGSDR